MTQMTEQLLYQQFSHVNRDGAVGLFLTGFTLPLSCMAALNRRL